MSELAVIVVGVELAFVSDVLTAEAARLTQAGASLEAFVVALVGADLGGQARSASSLSAGGLIATTEDRLRLA